MADETNTHSEVSGWSASCGQDNGAAATRADEPLPDRDLHAVHFPGDLVT